jgi:dihydrolipoamide dehydrogenase
LSTQALLNASHKYHDALHAFKKFGVIVDNVKIDWAAMQKQKDTAVAGLTKGVEGLFKKNKASKGWGRDVSCNNIQHAILHQPRGVELVQQPAA